MKVTKPFYLLSLVALALTGCNSSKGGGGGGGKLKPLVLTEEQQAIYEQYYCNQTDCFGNEGRTYDIINKVGADLMLELHKYLIDQHHHYLIYSKSAANEVKAELFEKVDKNDEGQIELFYTGKAISSYGSGQNREHVWPCANSGGLWYRDADAFEHYIDTNPNYWGGGSDAYHIRPADGEVNEIRSNSRFYQFKDGEKYEEVGEDGGSYTIKIDSTVSRKKVEVDDVYKGDTARLLAYLYVHYTRMGYDVYYSKDDPKKPVYTKEEAVTFQPGSHGKGHDPNVCGTLNFTNIFAYSTEAEAIKLLKAWNKIDDPSSIEKHRNDAVTEIQGNRNPFVDFPELIDRLF